MHESDFGKHFRMQYRLHLLNALNKVDTLFRSTDEAQALTDYFVDKGTPNEQMLAYYLLGRAYFDTHEAPIALHNYHIAAERADTTAEDCDYRQLSRIYGQMSNIFYQQNLMQESLECEDISIKYGWRSKDTLNALRSMAGKIFIYKQLQKSDSAILICDKVFKWLRQMGYKNFAAGYLASVIRELVDNNEISKAQNYMNIYESESGYFDSCQNIVKGREVYYYTKGYFFSKIDKNDSAEYYFRKELLNGKDYNNQNAAARGLALLFQKKHMPDSAAKYALYSYDMNDSVYAQMATTDVKQMQAMYDYSRNQEIARQEKEKAEKEHNKVIILTLAFFILALVVAFVIREIREIRKRQKVERRKYQENVLLLAKTQTDVIKLRSYGQELSQMVAEKEKEALRLAGEIDTYKEKIGLQKESAETMLQLSEHYDNLRKMAAKGLLLSEDNWQQIYMMTIEVLPNFYKYVSSQKLKLSDKEFKICILIRLHFIQKEIANMLGVSPAYISKLRSSIMLKLFGTEENPKELDKKLMQYS
jgi:large-conductance mechanosensitive channel